MGASFTPEQPSANRSTAKATPFIISRKTIIIVSFLVLGICLAAVTAWQASKAAGDANTSSRSTLKSKNHLKTSRAGGFSVQSFLQSIEAELDKIEEYKIEIEQHAQSLRQASGESRAEVRINGHTYSVPPNGELHKNIRTQDGNVEIHMQSHSSSSGTENSQRSRNQTRMHIRSHSSSDEDKVIKQEVRIR